MSPTLEVKVIAALTGPKTLGEVAARIGAREHEVLTTLSNLLFEGTVKRDKGQPCLWWLA